MNKTLAAAESYLACGLLPIPVPFKEKAPTIEGWPKLRFTKDELPRHFNGAQCNIGLILGDDYGTTDIDLDCNEALGAARELLPETNMIFGRPSKRASHYFYRTDPPTPSHRYSDPIDKACMVELRCQKSGGATGLQTIVPPSRHPCGEDITFEVGQDGHPANVEAGAIQAAVLKVAAASLLARYWPAQGSRHSAFLSLAGTLARAGWALDQAITFHRALYRALWGSAADMTACDTEVTSTYEKHGLGRKTTGRSTLRDFVNARAVSVALGWLGIRQSTTTIENETPSGPVEVVPQRIAPVIGVMDLEAMMDDQSICVADLAIDGLLPKRGIVLIGGRPKEGKAQPLHAKIMTPSGWRRMGELQVGDLVIGSDGGGTPILQIHPQGVMPCYRVTMSDGSHVETTWDHLWLVQDHHDRTSGRSGQLRTTSEVAAFLEGGKRRHAHIPLVRPVEFPESGKAPVHPYVLGVLLGDGGLTKSDVVITTADQEILERVRLLIPAAVFMSKRKANLAVCLRTRSRKAQDIKRSPMLTALRELGLMGKANPQKFIPGRYLLGNVSDRVQLLRGLMDTDGTISRAGSISFTTTSEKMASDFRELVWSLGGTAHVKSRRTWYRSLGHRKQGKLSYTLIIKTPLEIGSPFYLPRKTSRWLECRSGMKKPPTRQIVDIRFSRDALAQCITVKAEDGLYVTDDFILTHNSWFACQLGLAFVTGQALGGWLKVKEPGRCQLWALEDQYALTKDKFSKLLGENRPEGMRDLKILAELPQPILRGGDSIITATLKEHPAELLIFDSLFKLTGQRQSHSDIGQADYDVIDRLRKIALAHQCCVAVIMHTKKGARGGDPIENLLGTSGNTAAADVCCELKRTGHNGKLTVVGRMVPQEDYELLWHQGDQWGWTITSQGNDACTGETQEDVIAFLEAQGPSKPATIVVGVRKPFGAVWQSLVRLQARGKAARDGNRRWSLVK